MGLNPIELFRESVALGLAYEEYSARLFGNGANLQGVLEMPQAMSDTYILSSSGSTTLYRHTLGNQLSLKQDPGVTFTAADVVGTYFLSARRDDVTLATAGTIGVIPPPSCASNAAETRICSLRDRGASALAHELGLYHIQ